MSYYRYYYEDSGRSRAFLSAFIIPSNCRGLRIPRRFPSGCISRHCIHDTSAFFQAQPVFLVVQTTYEVKFQLKFYMPSRLYLSRILYNINNTHFTLGSHSTTRHCFFLNPNAILREASETSDSFLR